MKAALKAHEKSIRATESFDDSVQLKGFEF
jgi:hypothetical protein